ncbi:MAG: type IX secretion system membrane protein PorP/SprF [Bacteroidetes bacterium]|nr:type IX secretion system membrane protein PorP/SprF [Bacteroidota bacterium]
MCKRFLIIILFFVAGSAFAQDPEFTQFYANPLYLNPAFAGSAHCPRLNLNYRNQWPALTGTFVTYSASYDQHFDAISGGLGLLVLNDKAGEGTLTTTDVSFIYSYQMNVNREFSIRAGLQGTYKQKKVDWDKLTFGDMIDPRYGFIYPTSEIRPETTKSFWDFSAGVLAYSSNIYGGFAVNHMTQPEESFIHPAPGSKLPMKLTAHVGALIPLSGRRNEETYISPNVLYQLQRDFQQLNIGIYVAKPPLVGGLWYRNKDSFIALIGLQQGMFKFGYSYDLTVSKLANASAGSHELSFSTVFPCHPRKKRFRAVKCPAF